MSIKSYLGLPFRVEQPIKGLTFVQVASGATVPPHPHHEGYVVVPFVPASVERITHLGGQEINREPLTMLPLVPYYVDATLEGQTISLRNSGGGVSLFQKCVPDPPITGPQPELRLETVTVVSSGNRRNYFTAEMAVEWIEQAVGLMFRPKLPPDRAMLFVWSEPREVAMYMRNVVMPLDFLFIDKNFKISRIYQNAKPGDRTPIHSQGEVILTLEVLGGTVAALGIAEGDSLEV
ncbi:DUF192 domain-containing protein [Bradyrhizobium ivorense]|uniref:DUF192 domain-containing protein n=1 Tax=Bradyrhizobium ivorense TaxID=2511166 RepID=UPI0010BABB10|nr:DUF192 domain-containing protein [Bradyrhizobium ivorense]VIO78135.1 hypothetical protein CI41S_61390 [Bradyrhizobium ivorense]